MKKRPNFLQRLARKILPTEKVIVRSYTGAGVGRLFTDWQAAISTGDSETRSDLPTLRARCRDLERNSSFGRRIYQAIENNVLGSEGIKFQAKILNLDGTFDTMATDIIEGGFSEWGTAKNCAVSGDLTWRAIQKLVLRSQSRDGGFLIRKIKGAQAGNRFNFALQPIEIDHLDIQYNDQFANGNVVRMGVEFSQYNRVVAYWLLSRHPGDWFTPHYLRGPGAADYRMRIDASEIIHYFNRERATQSVGVPDLSACLQLLHNLDEYSKAELIAARASAAKGGYFTSTAGDEFPGQIENENTSRQATLSKFEPGSFDELPPGMEFKEYNPTHPNQVFPEYVRAMLRELAAGSGFSYMTITGDLSEANYSSMRSGALQEQENFKMRQTHLIENFCIPVFEAWLEMALLSGALNPLPFSKFAKFNRPLFHGRGWPWVDPAKDANARLIAINGGLETRASLLAQDGRDFEETLKQLAYEKKTADAYGLTFAKDPVTEKEIALAGKNNVDGKNSGQDSSP